MLFIYFKFWYFYSWVVISGRNVVYFSPFTTTIVYLVIRPSHKFVISHSERVENLVRALGSQALNPIRPIETRAKKISSRLTEIIFNRLRKCVRIRDIMMQIIKWSYDNILQCVNIYLELLLLLSKVPAIWQLKWFVRKRQKTDFSSNANDANKWSSVCASSEIYRRNRIIVNYNYIYWFTCIKWQRRDYQYWKRKKKEKHHNNNNNKDQAIVLTFGDVNPV